MDVIAALLPPMFMIAMIVLVGMSAYRATQPSAEEDAEDDARRQARPPSSPARRPGQQGTAPEVTQPGRPAGKPKAFGDDGVQG